MHCPFSNSVQRIAYPLKGSVRIRGNALPYIAEGDVRRDNRLPVSFVTSRIPYKAMSGQCKTWFCFAKLRILNFVGFLTKKISCREVKLSNRLPPKQKIRAMSRKTTLFYGIFFVLVEEIRSSNQNKVIYHLLNIYT